VLVQRGAAVQIERDRDIPPVMSMLLGNEELLTTMSLRARALDGRMPRGTSRASSSAGSGTRNPSNAESRHENRLIYWAYLLGAAIQPPSAAAARYWVGPAQRRPILFLEPARRQAVWITSVKFTWAAVSNPPRQPFAAWPARFSVLRQNLVDFFRYLRPDTREVRRIVSIEHVDYLTETYRAGGGLVVGHRALRQLGTGRGGGGNLGLKVNALELPQPIAKLNRLFQASGDGGGINFDLRTGSRRWASCAGSSAARWSPSLATAISAAANAHCLDFFGRPAPCPAGRPGWRSTRAPDRRRFPDRQVAIRSCCGSIPDRTAAGSTENEIRGKIARILEKKLANGLINGLFSTRSGGGRTANSRQSVTIYDHTADRARQRACIIIPAFNEARGLRLVVCRARAHCPDVVVLDDGSSDRTAATAEAAGATVVRHPQNRGKGVALQTGFAYARERGFDIAITWTPMGSTIRMNSRFLERMRAPAFRVEGNRMADAADMPRVRRWTNQFMSWMLSGPCGSTCRIPNRGYRLFPL
jgi:hypothetical protein